MERKTATVLVTKKKDFKCLKIEEKLFGNKSVWYWRFPTVDKTLVISSSSRCSILENTWPNRACKLFRSIIENLSRLLPSGKNLGCFSEHHFSLPKVSDTTVHIDSISKISCNQIKSSAFNRLDSHHTRKASRSLGVFYMVSHSFGGTQIIKWILNL